VNPQTAGLKLSIRALLRRMEFLAGGKLPLCVAGLDAEAAREAAAESGWELTEKPSGAVLCVESQDVPDLSGFASARMIAVIGKPAPAVTTHELGSQRPFKLYFTSTQILEQWIAPLPFRANVKFLWEKCGLENSVGGRWAPLPVRGLEECIYVLPGQSEGSAQRPSLADRAREGVLTLFGTGHIAVFGATLTSLYTGLAAALTCKLSPNYQIHLGIWLVMLLLSTWYSVVAERWARKHFLAEDPREFVLDEVAGMAIAILLLPAEVWSYNWAGCIAIFVFLFILFRIFDVTKVGAKWVDKTGWPGSIVWDDILAGFYTGLALRFGILLW